MNYSIIKDRDKLDEFIDFLPDLNESECYLLLLFARKKYAPKMSLRCGHQNMKRITCNKKELIYRKIRQMEIPLGGYMDQDIPIPQDALALYITINPRCLVKASKNLLKKLADTVTSDYDGYNPQNLALTEIHRAKSRSCFIDFDFDYSSATSILKQKDWIHSKYLQINEIVNKEALEFVITRGGFHALVRPELVTKNHKSFYKQIRDIGADVVGDNMLPVVGCVQGDFSPYFLKGTNGY